MRQPVWGSMRGVAISFLMLIGTVGMGCGTTASVFHTDDEGEDLVSEQRALELFSWWTAPGEAEALQSLIAIHQEKYPENRIFNAAIVDGENTRKLLRKRLDNGDPPDFYQGNIHDVRSLVKDTPQAAVALNTLFDDLGLREVLYPELLNNLEVDGRIVAMPVNVHRENTVFFNREIFRRLKLPFPRTFSELWEACASLKAAGVVPIATSHQGWILRIFFYSVAMGHMGSEAYAKFIRGQVSVERSKVRGAIHAFGKLLKNYTNADAGQKGFGWSQAASAVFHGDAAMMFHGDWLKGYFQSLGWQPGVDFSAQGAPGADDLFLYGMDVFVLPPNSQNKNAALRFLGTVASPEAQASFNGLKGSSPVRLDVPVDELDPLAAQAFEALRTARFRVLTGAPRQWAEALATFASNLDEEALYTAFVRFPPSPTVQP